MCPERHLLSAYVDGEVPSPWRERVERHVASCADCAKVAGRYRAMRSAFASDASPRSAEMRDEVWARLAARSRLARPARHGWSVSVPIPLLAAAGVAVTVMATLLAVRAVETVPAVYENVAHNRASVPAEPVTFGSPGFVVPPFDDRGTQLTITIELPKQADFDLEGQPVFVRTVGSKP